MREAEKTNRLRSASFRQQYLAGKVLDIGAGDNPVVPYAEVFDLAHGDAAHILNYRPAASYDTVHSSHCLEHMSDVPTALRGWWELVKPGGHLLLVVPDEDLYEQGWWPSLFNSDHKTTFRLGGAASWSPVSYELQQLLAALPESELIEVTRQDHGYRHDLRRPIGRWNALLMRLSVRRTALMFRLFPNRRWIRVLDRALQGIEHALGRPHDQTSGEALAQIQAIVRKRPGSSQNL